jgi:predicted lipid-binding transport protein (Tim44 family)
MNRIEKIKERHMREASYTIQEPLKTREDVSYLLFHISELEKKLKDAEKGLATECHAHIANMKTMGKRIDEKEAQLERIREAWKPFQKDLDEINGWMLSNKAKLILNHVTNGDLRKLAEAMEVKE